MKWLRIAIDWYSSRAALIALPVFLSIILFNYFWPVPPGHWFCKGGDPCVQQWVGALSGWIAAAIAIPTLLTLKNQLKEQRRQTEFLIGESIPTAVATDLTAKDMFVLNLHITNWNRRFFAIDRIECDNGFQIALEEVTVDGTRDTLRKFMDQEEGQSLEPEIALRGWEDRGKPPSSGVLTIRVLTKGEEIFELKRRSPEFVVHGRLIGETIAPISISVIGNVATF